MAAHQPSPTMMQMQQHQAQVAPPQNIQQGHFNPTHQIAAMNEAVWLQIGSFSELLRVPDEAMHAYERALQANPNSTAAMNAIGMLLKGREAFDKALEFFRAITQIEPTNGEAWGNLGHCFLMTENLQKAYDSYQHALVNLRDPKDPMLWYGIGILYDRYGSYDYAEEAFSQVMQIQPDFEKANEIYFRLGIIYKQQSKFNQSLDCFKYIVNSPPGPLTQDDIWFQIGHVHEQQKDFDSAKAAYQRVLDNAPNHAKVLQQLGWLHHQQNNAYETQDRAIQYLEKSVGSDNTDAQSWYLLGRCYMSQQKYPKAYEAYQQAVYRDGKNPTFWCSIGVLYYQINQYRDALDAYSRAIRLNPYISEVWYDLGTLYESCNNQITDALDAYQRAAELDPHNPHIKARLQLLRTGNAGGPPSAPQPADVHPQAYQAAGPVGPPWGGSAQQSSSGGPPPPPVGAGENWVRGLSGVNPPPQPPNPYEGREHFRGPPPQRQPSPQPEPQMRQPYAEVPRGPPPRRGISPAPPGHQYAQGPPPPPPPPPAQGPPQIDRRINNPNWGGSVPLPPHGPPPAPANGGTPQLNGMAAYRPTHSPRTDGRLAHDSRMPSPKSAYPQHQPPPPPGYGHHVEAPSQSATDNAHAPPSAPEVSASRIDDRPSSVGPKRMREWEEEAVSKKQANEESRARLDDLRHRRPSTSPSRDLYRRNSSEPRRIEEQRRGEDSRKGEDSRSQNDGYHPSEAAHHPQPMEPSQLPPIQQASGSMVAMGQEQSQAGPTPKKEERPPAEAAPASVQTSAEPERAARKMDVDEDYDDSGEDDKKAALSNGAAQASGSQDGKTSTPSSAGVNGSSGAPPKTE